VNNTPAANAAAAFPPWIRNVNDYQRRASSEFACRATVDAHVGADLVKADLFQVVFNRPGSGRFIRPADLALHLRQSFGPQPRPAPGRGLSARPAAASPSPALVGRTAIAPWATEFRSARARIHFGVVMPNRRDAADGLLTPSRRRRPPCQRCSGATVSVGHSLGHRAMLEPAREKETPA
jgi:hypothetical protein